MGEFKYFKIFASLASLWFLFVASKNYYLINNKKPQQFEIIDISKKYERHSFKSNAFLKINNEIYNFEVHPSNYDEYKNTGKVNINVYYDIIFKQYITTSDYVFSKNLCLILLLMNLIIYTVSLQNKVRFWLSKKVDFFFDYINRLFP